MSGDETEALLTVLFLGAIPVAFLIYAIPSIVAFRRRHPNRFAILVVNLAFGGTGIGWLGALVWAFSAVHLSTEPGGSHGGESGLNIFANDTRTVRLLGSEAGFAGERESVSRPSVSKIVGEIERLSALHAAGHLSETEFAELKADALRRIRVRTLS